MGDGSGYGTKLGWVPSFGDPLVMLAAALLMCAAVGGVILIGDLVPRQRRDRLSIPRLRYLAVGVLATAAAALVLLVLAAA